MIKRTKIIATLSAQRCTEDLVRSLYKAGMNIVRINSAHASLENAAEIVRVVRSVSKSIPVMLDTKGPEIRVTRMADAYPDGIRFAAGDSVKVRGTNVREDIPSTRETIYMNVEHIVGDVPVGATILIADGEMELHVETKSDEELTCRVMRDCTLRSRKSVNVPNVSIALPSVTEKDRRYIEWAVDNDIDFIAHSFVRSARDVRAVQEILDARHSNIKIISKIENQEGIDNIDEIIEASYGVMVARGDLGVELPAEVIPITQRMIVDKCIAAKRPVIIATQMLYSMVSSPRPTRAEVSDVASAIYERVDAVMLSDETASGAYPVESVETMARIAKAIERDEACSTPFIDIHMVSVNHEVTAQIARSAVRASTNLPIQAILLDTQTGRTGRYIAAFRPTKIVIAVCYTLQAQRLLGLSYGVMPILRSKSEEDSYHFLSDAMDFINLKYQELKDDDMVVIIGGSFGAVRGASYIEIGTIGDIRRRNEEHRMRMLR